ncbi:DUF3267 domain-containing protein [Alkalihalobacillus sp. R86527]|uniref:DUF3267 domain-containing protein n=1 Tax=Alkalihalobacillus sp. R86527 TaxID=3093863 RepID=UPI0036708E2D
MKFQSKVPKGDDHVHNELVTSGWTPLKEPRNPTQAILFSIPMMIMTALLSALVIMTVSSLSLREFGITASSITFTLHTGFLIGIVLLLIIHELFHLVFIPNVMKSDKTVVGVTAFGGFVVSEERISKGRYILITVAPFILLSILLPLVLSGFGLLTTTMKVLILLNAAASSVDLLSFILLVKQVPNQSTIVNNGMRTYWLKNVRSEIEKSGEGF